MIRSRAMAILDTCGVHRRPSRGGMPEQFNLQSRPSRFDSVARRRICLSIWQSRERVCDGETSICSAMAVLSRICVLDEAHGGVDRFHGGAPDQLFNVAFILPADDGRPEARSRTGSVPAQRCVMMVAYYRPETPRIAASAL